jgi:hypothetical protein
MKRTPEEEKPIRKNKIRIKVTMNLRNWDVPKSGRLRLMRVGANQVSRVASASAQAEDTETVPGENRSDGARRFQVSRDQHNPEDARSQVRISVRCSETRTHVRNWEWNMASERKAPAFPVADQDGEGADGVRITLEGEGAELDADDEGANVRDV